MSDIVERLRAKKWPATINAIDEAADEIERLHALLAEAGEVLGPLADGDDETQSALAMSGLRITFGVIRAARAFIEKLGRVE